LEEAIRKVPEVISCHYISGSGTFELQVVARDLESFSGFVRNVLLRLPNVKDVHTIFSLGEVKSSSALPLPTAACGSDAGAATLHEEEEEEAPAPVTSGVSMLGVSSAGAGGTLSQSAAAVGRRAAPPVRLLRQPLRLMPGPPNLGLSRHAKHWPQSSPVAGVITGTICGADTVRAGGSAPLLPSPAASEPRPRRVAGGDSV
jgi:hypothetical protein